MHLKMRQQKYKMRKVKTIYFLRATPIKQQHSNMSVIFSFLLCQFIEESYFYIKCLYEKTMNTAFLQSHKCGIIYMTVKIPSTVKRLISTDFL